MGKWSKIGKGITKAVKFVFNHRKEIETAATAAKDTALFVSDMKQGQSKAKSEKEHFALVAKENSHMKSTITEIEAGIAALEKRFNGKIQELECAMEDIGSDLTATKEDLGNQLNKLNENLAQLNKTQEAYQKRMETRLLLLSICGGVGILLAIILAVVL